MSQTFDVRIGGKDGGARGTLKLSSESFRWDARDNDRRVEVKAVDVEGVQWCRTGKHFQLRIKQSDGTVTRFDGFDSQDHKALQEYCRQIKTEITVDKVDVQGKNAGVLEVSGEELIFSVDGKRSFDISLADVSNTQATPKDEIILEFTQQDNIGKKQESLLEMRFYIPNTEDTEMGENEEVPKKSVELFHQEIQRHVALESGGDQIARLEGVKCRIPRATFEIALYGHVFKMHGATYDFTVKYKHVQKMLIVPAYQGQGHYFVLSLDPPLRKGNTMYNSLVSFFEDTEEEEEIHLNLPSDFDSRYKDVKGKDKIKSPMEGNYLDIVTNLFQVFCSTAAKPVKPIKQGKFKSVIHEHLPSIKCSIGANLGALYLLDNCFLFLEKPPLVFMYEDVESIYFERNKKAQLTSANSFDFKIKLESGKSQEFNLIPKKELKNLENWFTAVSEQKFQKKKMKIANYTSDDSNDEADDKSDDDDIHIKNRINAEEGGEDDDSSSEDGDFVGAAGSESSSEEDSDEDSDDDSSNESGSDDEGSSKKKDKKDKKKSKEKDKKKKKEKSKKEKSRKDDTPKKPAKVKKDPNAPKRAKSAWLLFCDAKREEVKENNPGIAFTEINAKISEQWNKLTPEEKKPFEDKAKKLSETYKEDKAKYDKENPEAAKAGKRKKKGGGDDSDEGGGKGKEKKKAKKDPNAPKKGLSSYMIFCAATRDSIKEKNPDIAQKDILRELGAKWKELTAEEKKKWEDKAAVDKARYEKENAAYKASGGGAAVKSEPTLDEFVAKAESDGDSGSADSEDSD
eukprot:CAMPEP_0181305358 /NCGR_PEP_ID=MMETSP1101-20121128/9683_1 /TAXON_ID=46948 /ORGANISM="Rhodomonas abbreviata, Strain Caron Lab Isolate" /LENGTH=795 /DNA_ID=CAMNT_0023411261 /DNA_START=27 /DNA_END=2414 /DNA_ORIENTATION=+